MRKLICCLSAIFLLACRGEKPKTDNAIDAAQKILQQNDRWRFYFEENRINRLLFALSQQYTPKTVAFMNVNLISMAVDSVAINQTVIVEGGLIKFIGSLASMKIPPPAVKIDGTGKYLIPGLVDMHVHTTTSKSQDLLNLAKGITTVRDLCGFPWMLKSRAQIRANKLLAPNLYLSGPLLNAFKMEIYGESARTPEDGRRLVREHKQAGYDFIKVHNNLKFKVYQALLEEAAKENIPVVGHVPHDIKIADAIALGQRTFEHFKGYYLDKTLEMTDEDYAALTDNANVWNCPTFYTYRLGLRGKEAGDLITQREEMKYVSAYDKQQWLKTFEYSENGNAALKVYEMSKEIFKNLLRVKARFVAGTDCGGGYAMMVPGFALHEELRIMEQNGMSPVEVLKTATVNAAEAMNRREEFGAIEIGKRADVVLLGKNPLELTAHLSQIRGVMVRGIWLPQNEIEAILQQVENIYKHEGDSLIVGAPSSETINDLIKSALTLHEQGFIFMDHHLDELAKLLNEYQRTADARKLQDLRTVNY